MTKQKMTTIFKKYQRSSAVKKQKFLDSFEKKMIYRTTKTENPETTKKMVDRALHKITTK